MRSWLLNKVGPLLLVLLGIASTLVGLEILLRFEVIPTPQNTSPHALPPIDIPDSMLGFRPNPQYPSHDRNGWRNKKVVSQSDVVVLGDSQTYGLGATREESWPSIFGTRSGRATYQLAFGGYGPAHYLALLDEVVALNPKIVIASLYFGNDVLDSYWLTYRPDTIPPTKRRIREFRPLDNLISKHQQILNDLDMAERIDPYHVRHKYLDCQTYREIPAPDLQRVSKILQSSPLGQLEQLQTKRESEKKTRNLNFEIFAVAWRAFDNIRDELDKYRVYEEPLCVQFRWSNKRIIFSPAYRLLTLDDSDPRVVEGKRITSQALVKMSRELSAKGIRFYVLLIPTKEYVFKNMVAGKINTHPWLDLLWYSEETFRQEVISLLNDNGIEYIDSLPALRRRLDEGEIPYPNSTGKSNLDADGHPNAIGYRKIGETIHSFLQGQKH